MTNTKKRKKLLWDAMMLMNDTQRCKGWYEPLKSYKRLLFRRDGRTIRKAAIRVTSV
jgi:hypothetical protein